MPALAFRRYDAAGAREIRSAVESIFRESYTGVASDDLFHSTEEFMRRFDAYASRDNFDLVMAYDGDKPVGQAWGWPLDERAGKGWWSGLEPEPEPRFTRENGKRTFALSEVMVCSAWTGRGIAHALHDNLLSGRYEQRATLLVRPDNDTAYGAYLRWGWRKVAQLQPKWPDAPLFDVLMLPLPLKL